MGSLMIRIEPLFKLALAAILLNAVNPSTLAAGDPIDMEGIAPAADFTTEANAIRTLSGFELNGMQFEGALAYSCCGTTASRHG